MTVRRTATQCRFDTARFLYLVFLSSSFVSSRSGDARCNMATRVGRGCFGTKVRLKSFKRRQVVAWSKRVLGICSLLLADKKIQRHLPTTRRTFHLRFYSMFPRATASRRRGKGCRTCLWPLVKVKMLSRATAALYLVDFVRSFMAKQALQGGQFWSGAFSTSDSPLLWISMRLFGDAWFSLCLCHAFSRLGVVATSHCRLHGRASRQALALFVNTPKKRD